MDPTVLASFAKTKLQKSGRPVAFSGFIFFGDWFGCFAVRPFQCWILQIQYTIFLQDVQISVVLLMKYASARAPMSACGAQAARLWVKSECSRDAFQREGSGGRKYGGGELRGGWDLNFASAKALCGLIAFTLLVRR